MDWTTLPGPTAFIERTAQDLSETYSVVSRCPAYLDDSWSRKLKARLEGFYAWNDVLCSPEDFYRFCAQLCGKEKMHGPHDLQRETLHCQLFYISFPSAEEWSRWTSLLTEFVIAQKTFDEKLQRNVMLVALNDDGLEVPNEALLKKRDILDFLRDEDPFFHACQCSSRDGSNRSIEEDIRIHICSELALWDFDLCRYLLDFPLEQLVDPIDVIKGYAEARGLEGWDGTSVFESGRNTNSAGSASSVTLALNGNREELTRRVWRGQVQVLFPLIEDQRCKLIERLRSMCPEVPRRATNEDGIVEIGPLHYHMRRERKCPRQLENFAFRLKEMRNDIAHLRACKLHHIPDKSELLT